MTHMFAAYTADYQIMREKILTTCSKTK